MSKLIKRAHLLKLYIPNTIYQRPKIQVKFQDYTTRHMLDLFIVTTKGICFLQLKVQPTANYTPSSISSTAEITHSVDFGLILPPATSWKYLQMFLGWNMNECVIYHSPGMTLQSSNEVCPAIWFRLDSWCSSAPCWLYRIFHFLCINV